MCSTPKHGGTSVACAAATTHPAKRLPELSTSSATVSSISHAASAQDLLTPSTINSAAIVVGYNEVVRIPSGATNIDVRQHSYSGKPEDDNYLGEAQP